MSYNFFFAKLKTGRITMISSPNDGAIPSDGDRPMSLEIVPENSWGGDLIADPDLPCFSKTVPRRNSHFSGRNDVF